jgi:hypothetical protein
VKHQQELLEIEDVLLEEDVDRIFYFIVLQLVFSFGNYHPIYNLIINDIVLYFIKFIYKEQDKY